LPRKFHDFIIVLIFAIELKGERPESFHPSVRKAGNHTYGCDICQKVSPFCKRQARPTTELALQTREITARPKIIDLLLIDDEFHQKFKGSAVKRAKRCGLLRYEVVASAASNDPGAERALEIACGDPEPLVREHAGWTLERIRERKEHSEGRCINQSEQVSLFL
jgi:epoxyqueuosine reductase